MPANLFRRGDTWYGRFYSGGSLQRVSLQTTDLREAKGRLKALKIKAERAVFGLADAAIWEDAVSGYGEGVLDTGGVKASTAKRYLVSIRQLHSTFAGRKLPTITEADISNYAAARQKAGATNSTIRRDLVAMSRVLAFARSKGMIQANPAEQYDRSMLRERRAGITAPDDAAIDAGAAAAVKAGSPDLALAMRFLRATGMRTGELLRARWEHLHGTDLTIPETKNGRARTIALGAAMLPAKRKAGLLFAGLPETAVGLAGRWAYVRRSLPTAHRYRLHDLRHAYAIAEIRSGRDIYDLSHHMGHSSVKVTEIYLGWATGKRAKSRTQVTQQVTQAESERAQKTADATVSGTSDDVDV